MPSYQKADKMLSRFKFFVLDKVEPPPVKPDPETSSREARAAYLMKKFIYRTIPSSETLGAFIRPKDIINCALQDSL